MLDYIACSDPWMVRTILGWSNTADSEHVELCSPPSCETRGAIAMPDGFNV